MSGGYMVLGREAASNNAESFDFVFSVHRDYVYGLTHALLGNMQDAEDVTQDVFLRVYKALHTYRPERASMRTWLTKMAVNACNTHRRRTILRGLWQQTASDNANPALERIDSSILAAPEDHAMRAEVRRAVQSAITGLRPEHRTVLVLHYYMDFSCPEIAAVLECPEGTVYSRLHYARRVIQARLERHSFHSNREA